MSIPIARRKDACLYFLRNNFDIEATEKWVLQEFEEYPAMQRTKHPDKLARNLFMMGGTGDQREMNASAFKDAVEIYVNDIREKTKNAIQRENESLEGTLETERNRNHDLASENRDQARQIATLQDKLKDAEISVLKLEQGREVETTPA